MFNPPAVLVVLFLAAAGGFNTLQAKPVVSFKKNIDQVLKEWNCNKPQMRLVYLGIYNLNNNHLHSPFNWIELTIIFFKRWWIFGLQSGRHLPASRGRRSPLRQVHRVLQNRPSLRVGRGGGDDLYGRRVSARKENEERSCPFESHSLRVPEPYRGPQIKFRPELFLFFLTIQKLRSRMPSS